jgi:hypothetical protein
VPRGMTASNSGSSNRRGVCSHPGAGPSNSEFRTYIIWHNATYLCHKSFPDSAWMTGVGFRDWRPIGRWQATRALSELATRIAVIS